MITGPVSKIKKTEPIKYDPGIPFFLQDLMLILYHGQQHRVTGRSSDSWIILKPPLPMVLSPTVAYAVFVPSYSDGSVPEFHRVPYYAFKAPKPVLYSRAEQNCQGENCLNGKKSHYCGLRLMHFVHI